MHCGLSSVSYTHLCVERIKTLEGDKKIVIVDNASPNGTGQELLEDVYKRQVEEAHQEYSKSGAVIEEVIVQGEALSKICLLYTSITGNISLVMVCSCNVRYLSGPQNMPSRGVSHKGRILFFNMAHSLENCTKNTNIYTNI